MKLAQWVLLGSGLVGVAFATVQRMPVQRTSASDQPRSLEESPRQPATAEVATMRAVLQPAGRDAFTSPKLEVAPLPAAPAPVKTAINPPPPPAPPSPPAVSLLIEGQMKSPAGERVVFGSVNGASVLLKAGVALQNGYIVDAVTESEVQLSYPPLGTTARVALPSSPNFEIR